MKNRILVIYAFPETSNFSREYANKYMKGAVEGENEIKLIDLSKIRFDPVLWGGYNSSQLLEEDLLATQIELIAAKHIIFMYPLWWSGIPALLKGFLERILLPGFAFKFN